MSDQYTTGRSNGPSQAETASSKTDVAKSQASEIAGTATEQASSVASTAISGSQQVASEAKEHAIQVAGEARDQLRTMLEQSRTELRNQASEQSTRMAAGMRNMSDQLHALADGRTDEAGNMIDLVRQGGDRLAQYAGRIEHGGYQALLDDARRFARRRPGMFLLTAVAAGFATGRLIRGVQAANGSGDESRGGTGGYSTGGYSTGGYSTGGYSTGGYSTGGYATGGYSTGGYTDPTAAPELPLGVGVAGTPATTGLVAGAGPVPSTPSVADGPWESTTALPAEEGDRAIVGSRPGATEEPGWRQPGTARPEGR